MSQMVLPQNLSSSASPEAAKPTGNSRSASENSGENAFDTVSRIEQKRLEARQAQAAKDAKDASQAEQASSEKPAQGKPDSEKMTDSSESRPESAVQEPSGKDLAGKETWQGIAADVSSQGKVSENPELLSAAGPAADTPDDIAIDGVPVTFVGLQSLVASPRGAEATTNSGKTVGARANGQSLPFIQGSMLTMTGTNGKSGAMMLQPGGQGGSASGMALGESMLAGLSGEAARASDSPILQNAIRFQGALDSVSAQANAVNTPKMAPDAPVLRGYTTSIDLPVGHAEWGDKVAGKLTWLTARNMSVAEIHLTPPDMGPMEVKVSVQQDQANIQVHSANPVVREQLELHSHRLRDMLGEQGLSLEQFDVSDSDSGQAGDGDAGNGESTGTGVIADAESEQMAGEPVALDLTWRGEVDIFA